MKRWWEQALGENSNQLFNHTVSDFTTSTKFRKEDNILLTVYMQILSNSRQKTIKAAFFKKKNSQTPFENVVILGLDLDIVYWSQNGKYIC